MSETYMPEEATNFIDPDTSNVKEKPHLTQFVGKKYDVRKLQIIAEAIPTTEFPLTDSLAVTDILQSKFWKSSNGDSIGPSDLLAAFEESNRDWTEVRKSHPEWSVHLDKLIRVNYRTPALVHAGHLIDGLHRLTKAIADKAPTLPVKVLTELPFDTEYNG